MPYFKVFLYSILPWCPFCTYTVGIPWIWIGVGWTMPFFFKPLRIAAKAKNRCHVEPREALCRQSVSCVGEGVCRNLVEISSLWSFWLEEGCCLHQPRCETSSWHAHFGCLACSGYSEVPSSCKYSRIHGEQKKLDKKKKKNSLIENPPCFYGIIIYDTFGHFFHRHQSWQRRKSKFSKCFNIFNVSKVNLIKNYFLFQSIILLPLPSATLSRIFSSSFSCFSLADSLRATDTKT